jgi:hypothetical protein
MSYESDMFVHNIITSANHPDYASYVRDNIKKLAESRLKLDLIARRRGTNAAVLSRLHETHSIQHWTTVIDAILKRHRANFGEVYLPRVLPPGVRMKAAEALHRKHHAAVTTHMNRLRAQHTKMEKKVKQTVKRRS